MQMISISIPKLKRAVSYPPMKSTPMLSLSLLFFPALLLKGKLSSVARDLASYVRRVTFDINASQL